MLTQHYQVDTTVWPFYIGGNYGTEELSTLSKITKAKTESGRTGLWSQVVQFQGLCFYQLHYFTGF